MLDTDTTFTVRVFREDPIWDKYERWFMVPTPDLRRLFVGGWTCHEDHALALTTHLHAEYPNHVLVYATQPEAKDMPR